MNAKILRDRVRPRLHDNGYGHDGSGNDKDRFNCGGGDLKDADDDNFAVKEHGGDGWRRTVCCPGCDGNVDHVDVDHSGVDYGDVDNCDDGGGGGGDDRD
eukprot:4724342-Pleurochrysis_carterae.AAC.1